MERFGRLTLKYAFRKDKRIFFMCVCDCGKEKAIYNRSIINGKTKSCGCLKAALSSKRMSKNNPVHMKGVKARMMATNKRLGTRPKIRGGNGTEMPIPQRTLLAALGTGWYAEHSVPTKLRGKTKERYPTCYKIDIANPVRMIGIEIDGSSHKLLGRQRQDKKKTKFLASRGWKMFRVKNKDVMANLEVVLTIIT